MQGWGTLDAPILVNAALCCPNVTTVTEMPVLDN